jgi:HK97 family phage prohead protease
MPVQLETRGTLKATEVRASKAAGKFELTGRCASYNTPTKINEAGGPFLEQVAPGAFSRSLTEGADVKATFNHDPNHILGRTKSGTLILTDSKAGLNFRCVLDPNNSMHRDIHASVLRGDHSECSFAFRVPPGGDTWGTTTDAETGRSIPLRTLTDVDLVDVAPAVTYPAYKGDATQVSARAAAHRTSTLTAEECARLQGVDVATLQRKDLAIRRSVATRQGQKIAAHETQELRRRAAALGAQIAADEAQEKRDNEMQRRAEGILGIVFGRKSHPGKRDSDSGAPDTYPYELASAVASQLGHKLVGANSTTAFTKHAASGTKWSVSYEKSSTGAYSFGKPTLGGHPPTLGEEDVS